MTSTSGPENYKKESSSKKKVELADFEFIEVKTKFGVSSVLGKGAYGIVRYVKMKETGKEYAMKIVIYHFWSQDLTKIR